MQTRVMLQPSTQMIHRSAPRFRVRTKIRTSSKNRSRTTPRGESWRETNSWRLPKTACGDSRWQGRADDFPPGPERNKTVTFDARMNLFASVCTGIGSCNKGPRAKRRRNSDRLRLSHLLRSSHFVFFFNLSLKHFAKFIINF